MKYVRPRDATTDAPYVDRNVTAGVNGSVVPAEFFNALQAEILAVILYAGLTPNGNNLEQLKEAILAMIAAALEGGEEPLPFVHPDRLVATEEGITGGGDLSEDRTLKLAFAALTLLTDENLADADLFAVYDASAAAHRKITWAGLKAEIAGEVGGGGGGIEDTGLYGVGSYIVSHFIADLGNIGIFQTPVLKTVGATAAGTNIAGSPPGTWRIHGVIADTRVGTTPDLMSMTYIFTEYRYLLKRIA